MHPNMHTEQQHNSRREVPSSSRRRRHSGSRREEHGSSRRREHSGSRRKEHGSSRLREHSSSRRKEYSSSKHPAGHREEYSRKEMRNRGEKEHIRGGEEPQRIKSGGQPALPAASPPAMTGKKKEARKAKQQPLSDTDGSNDSFFPGIDAVLASEVCTLGCMRMLMYASVHSSECIAVL